MIFPWFVSLFLFAIPLSERRYFYHNINGETRYLRATTECPLFVKPMDIKYKFHLWVTILFCAIFFVAAQAFPQNDQPLSPASDSKALTLAQAVMCEDIKDFSPQIPAIVFSITIGKVSCFTLFDPVPAKTFIYHNWFHRDEPSTRKKLSLNPPRWSTYSSIQLRETDKGPWRVEISDQRGTILHVLRFSITD